MLVSMVEQEIPLSGGNVNAGVVRVGNTVRRHPGHASQAVHMLLQHLDSKHFQGSPKLLGMDEQGREMLSFIQGEAGQWPAIWISEDALVTSALLLKNYHNLTVDLVASNASWAYAHPDRTRHEVICHNDYGAYNIVFKDMKAVGIIDFDLAGPGPRLKDVAYAAYWMTPLSLNTDDMRPFAEADLLARSRRLKLFCASYGVPADTNLLDMIREVLRLMGDEAHATRMVGEAAAAKLIADGHLAGWRGEAKSFMENRQRLAQSIGIY
jgi:hypothetical protein